IAAAGSPETLAASLEASRSSVASTMGCDPTAPLASVETRNNVAEIANSNFPARFIPLNARAHYLPTLRPQGGVIEIRMEGAGEYSSVGSLKSRFGLTPRRLFPGGPRPGRRR